MKASNTITLASIKLAKPAQRALQHAGITTLKQLAQQSETEISQLHGIGQNAMIEIKKTLKQAGLSFAVKKSK